MSKYANGMFQLTNPSKYVGKKDPHYRSSWEHAVMRMLDNNPSILQWANESIHINYRNPFTGKQTIYVPDFFVMYTDANQAKHAELWEVKPKKETTLENARSPRDKATAVLNMAKWQAARTWCSAHNLQFRILTEEQIFHQGVSK